VFRRAVLLFIGVLTLYVFSLAPTFLWSDSAKLAIFAYKKEFVSGGFGLHTGHSLLGYLFSFLPFSFAYTQNLMSAVFGALTIVILFLIIRLRAPDHVAFLASAAFGVSQLFWGYSVINETYSLLIFFIALFLYCVLKAKQHPAYLYTASLVLGFGFSNHGVIVLAVPGAIVLLWDRKFFLYVVNVRLIVLVNLFIIGACQVFLLPNFYQNSPGLAVSKDLVHNFQMFWPGLSKFLQEAIRYPFYLAYQFPTVAFLFGIYGFVRLWNTDRKYILATLMIWLCFLIFSLQYFFQRQFAMMIPTFFIFALWIPEGLKAWLGRIEQNITHRAAITVSFILMCILPGLIYYSVYRVTEEKGWKLSGIRELPYRNNIRYFLFPPKNSERGAEIYVNDCFRQAEPNAVILSDFNPGIAIQYGQIVLKKRPDIFVQILDPWLFSSQDPAAKISEFLRNQLAENKAVYLADNWDPYYKVSQLSNEFDFKQEGGPLWQVTAKPKPQQ